MPGRTPQDAVNAFIKPLTRALSVFDAYAAIHLSRRGGYFVGQELAWILNEGDGVELAGAGTYFAEMGFKIVEADPAKHEGKYRVTTQRYRYKLQGVDGKDIFRAHWHPDGKSSYQGPHIHVQPDLKLHLITPRITLEQTIQWCIQHGASLSCTTEEAENRLADTQWPHMLYRTWVNDPDENTPPASQVEA